MPLICLFGPDGSGKSTLARALAEEFKRRKLSDRFVDEGRLYVGFYVKLASILILFQAFSTSYMLPLSALIGLR